MYMYIIMGLHVSACVCVCMCVLIGTLQNFLGHKLINALDMNLFYSIKLWIYKTRH